MNEENILDIAKELGTLINNREEVIEFNKVKEKFDNDKTAQHLFNELVIIGGQLSEKGAKGEAVKLEQSAEYKILEQKLSKNETVKEFISAQKKYLNLISSIQQAIREEIEI